jgi:hypothetical protein
MGKGSRILLLCVLALVFAWSALMLRRVLGLHWPWLAILLMFYFLGLLKVAEPLFMLRVPARWRRLRRWEVRSHALRRFGILAYGQLLRSTPLRYLNLAVYVRSGSRDFRRVLLLTESGEAAHFWAALLLLPCIGYALFQRAYADVAWLVLAELLVNVYPMLHLRYVRSRLERLIARR